MIFKSEPENWQELQEMVGQLFKECGFLTEVSKKVSLVRGSKEIDVFVQDLSSEYKPIILIECKFWNTAISQETVHSFRTIVEDFGANLGFIVSKRGFQSGSFEAARNTNIRLVTLTELVEVYYSRWLRGMVAKHMPIADFLFPYWDFAGGKHPKDGQVISWDSLMLLNQAYRPICSLGPGDQTEIGFKRNYPQKLPVINDDFQIVSWTVINDDREYFEFIEKNQDKAIKHYKKLYREEE